MTISRKMARPYSDMAAGIGFRVLVSVRRRNPDLDGKGAYQLKGGYHVSFRHSFNRRHYRRGT